MERRSSSLPLFQVRADPVAMALVYRESGEMLLALGEETTFPDRDLTMVLLSSTATAAILGGAPFDIDLVLDRGAGLR